MDRARPSLPRNESFFNYPKEDEEDANPTDYHQLKTNYRTNKPTLSLNNQKAIYASPKENREMNNLRRHDTVRWNMALKETMETMPSRTLPRNFVGKYNWNYNSGAQEGSRLPLENFANNIASRMEEDQNFMEDNPQSAFFRQETIRDMPHCLTVKRIIRNRLTQTVSKKSKRRPISFFKRNKYKTKMQLIKIRNWLSNIVTTLELWYNALKKIEGNFGSAVAVYFRFLRWLFIINFLLAIPIFGFIIVPQLLYVSDDYFQSNNSKLLWYDVFSGEGYLKNTILYYGYYTNKTVTKINNHYYHMPQAYILTMVSLYIFAFIVVSYSTAGSYRRSFIETKTGLQNVFAQKVFCGWDFNIATKEAAELKSSALYNEFKELLSDIINPTEDVSCFQTVWNWTMQILINLGTFVLLFVVGLVVWLLLEERNKSVESTEEKIKVALITAVVINVSMLLLPILFGYVTKFENYKFPGLAFNITLVRTYLLELTIVGVLLTFWLMNSEEELCWETSLGQEIYRLIIFDFIISVVLSSILEGLRFGFEKACRGKEGLAEFDISRHTIQLIYSQTLFWVGLFLSPLLPIIVTLKIWLTWYIKIFCTLHFCKPYVKSWRAAQTYTLLFVLTFLTLFIVLIFYGYLLTQIPASECGPFREYSYIYEIITDGVLNLQKESTFWQTVMFLTRPGVITVFILALGTAVYFLRAKAIAQQNMAKILKKILVLSAKDREFLLNYISTVTADHWQQNSPTSIHDDFVVDYEKS